MNREAREPCHALSAGSRLTSRDSRGWLSTILVALLLVSSTARASDRWEELGRELTEYRRQVAAVCAGREGRRELPQVPFFLFGMGGRGKWLYRDGALLELPGGREIRRWDVAEERIVPSAYAVALKLRDGRLVVLEEDGRALWLGEGDRRMPLAQGHVVLPRFDDRRFPAVLRVLHQELLVNVVDGLPVPNLFVYRKPWYRDGAMVAMALDRTGNLPLLRDWILSLRDPFDRNNAGETEADNPGQVLYLASLASDASHPVVAPALAALEQFRKADHVEGRSDFALHPVYQTRWANFGLHALGLPDPYRVPEAPDSYASLFWWNADASPRRAAGPVIASDDYPYLTWAGAHTTGRPVGKLSDRDYPLTWEARASQADYEGMRIVSPAFVDAKLCAPHTWHAAEAFLLLHDLPR